MSKSKARKKTPKRVLALPDLEHARTAVLNSLTSASGQRTYDHAIREFVTWYCSEPRLAFNRTVVLRYRIHLEQRGYAPATINLRLAAVRRVAYEAADAGLLSPELAAGIRRVKGVRRIGVRLGNWLTPEQGRRLLEEATLSTRRGLRDHAMVAMLIGCGLRRGELLALRLESIQQREEHWVIADLVGKGGHVRTVPIPGWVKTAVDAWTEAAAITHGPVFRAINKAGRIWGDGMSSKVLWDVVRAALSVFVGFAPTHYLKGLYGTPALSPLVHVHGMLFTLWTLFVVTQTTLVATRRTDVHRRLGIVGGMLAVAMLAVGTAVAIPAAKRDPIQGFSLPWNSWRPHSADW